MSSHPEHSDTEPAADSSPTIEARSRWSAPLAFVAGGVLTALALFAAVQFGALDAFANTPPPPGALSDPRIDRLLGLLASERDCDSDCLADLKTRADKSDALQQALGALQESVDTAQQRVKSLEGERREIEWRLAELGEAQAQQSQRADDLEEEKKALTAQMAAKVAELEDARKQQAQRVAELEAEKLALAQELGRKLAEMESARQRQEQRATGLEGERAALQQRLAALEKRLAEANATPKLGSATPRAMPKAKEPPPPAPVASLDEWTVHAMTPTTLVVSAPGHRFTALAVGEELNGVKITAIDAAQGMADTSAGPLNYRK